MLLQNKNAIIYGAGGSLGSAVAKALAAAGARVFLTGRNAGPVKKVADEIIAHGGLAEVDEVDALDEKAINDHINSVVQQVGTVDISFNAVGVDVVQGIPLVDMPADDFMSPVTNMLQTRFLTATAAVAYRNARRNRLPIYRRVCGGMLRCRKFFAEPGRRVGCIWYTGGKYPVWRFARFESICGCDCRPTRSNGAGSSPNESGHHAERTAIDGRYSQHRRIPCISYGRQNNRSYY
jgi:NAD(P)-dependent dehydrogenase (short-subunit alcohol dehydrogenase family)